jgi:transposase InsO family protein
VKLHPNARTTPHLRRLLVDRVLQEGWTLAGAARAVGLSRTCARRWLQRYLAEGDTGLQDRSSRPRRSPARTCAKLEQRVLALRRTRLVAVAIGHELGIARSTVGAILRRHGLSRLRSLDPKPPIVRYERSKPGELLHLDTKKLGRIKGVGHRIHGDRSIKTRGIGWEYAHIAIDDFTRLSYVEVLPDETGATAADFYLRALRFFERKGIQVERVMTDNGSCYKSSLFEAICVERSIRHIWTRPYTPRTNGKAERLVQTLLREWAYVRAYTSSKQRTRYLSTWVRHYNRARPHAGIGGVPPMARLRRWKQPA